MMESKRRTNASALRRALAGWSNGLVVLATTMCHETIKELTRLNSARIGPQELSRLAPRKRARAVKDALAAHHAGHARCC
jgi:hypothetical protein